MENSVVVVAIDDQAVAGFPSVGVDRTAFERFALYYIQIFSDICKIQLSSIRTF